MLNREEKEFAELFYTALKDEGLGIPTTIEEVEATEKAGVEIDFKDLPTRLQDAAEVLRQRKVFTLKFKNLNPDEEPCQNLQLARAARLGREIPEEIEEKMREDRAAAKERSKK